MQQCRIDHHRRQGLLGIHNHLDRLRERLAQNVRKFTDRRRHIDSPGCHRCLAGKCEDLLHQRTPPVACLTDSVDTEVELLLVAPSTAEQFNVPADDVENVIDVVGNAAGERAKALQLLHLEKLFLQPFPLRDVLDGPEHLDRLAIGRILQLPQTMHPTDLVVTGADDTIGLLKWQTFCDDVLAQIEAHLFPLVRMHDIQSPLKGTRIVPGNAKDGIQRLRVRPESIRDVEHVVTHMCCPLSVIEERFALAQRLFGSPARFFGELALADVVDILDVEFLVAQPEVIGEHLHRKQASVLSPVEGIDMLCSAPLVDLVPIPIRLPQIPCTQWDFFLAIQRTM